MLEIKGSIRFQGYVIDRPGWTLRWADKPIALNRKSLDVLLYLVDHRDRVVSKDELLETLWAGQFVEEGNLTQQIFLLRKALSRHDSRSTIIETIPGRGYRFVATLSPEPETEREQDSVSRITLSASDSRTTVTIEEEVDDAEPAVSPALEKGARRTRHAQWALAGALAATALAIVGWFGWQQWLDRTGGEPVDVVIAPISGSTGDAVLDQALVAALRMDLSQSPFVSVVSGARVRATLTEMKQNPDAGMAPAIGREVCERTNSQAVLHGSVIRLPESPLWPRVLIARYWRAPGRNRTTRRYRSPGSALAVRSPRRENVPPRSKPISTFLLAGPKQIPMLSFWWKGRTN